MRRLALFFMIALGCAAAHAGPIVLLTRIGTDSAGNPLFRQANAQDYGAQSMTTLIQGSNAIQEASRYYDAIQQSTGQGAQPTFVEINRSSGGSYNDWKGSFSLQNADGSVTKLSQPRVVFPLGGDVATSGDSGLVVQTLVHEMGHGAMAQAYATSQRGLPTTSNLGKAHSGGSVTDGQLAFIEGWAEFVGAYFTGRTTIAQDPAGAIDQNWYAQSANGGTKSGAELLQCEGWEATVLYKVTTDAKDQNALWKITQVMTRTAPQSLPELFANVARTYPELVPVLDRDVAQLSKGQFASLAALEQTAGIAYTSPTPGPVGNNPAPVVVNNGGGGDRIGTDLAALRTRMQQIQAELDQLSWWHLFRRWRLKRELSQVRETYNEESLQLSGAASASAPQSTSPAAPETYRGVIQAIRGGDDVRVRQALDAHRAAMQRVRDQRSR
jgi:hypothetical protein